MVIARRVLAHALRLTVGGVPLIGYSSKIHWHWLMRGVK